MKRRIEQLLNGIFEYEPVKLRIIPPQIKAEARKDSVVCGSFRIEAEDGRKVRGFLYSPDPRIVCSPVEFQGTSCDIHYQIDCNGLPEGFETQGKLTVCSDHGEYALPYTLSILKEEMPGRMDGPKSMEELAGLAQEEFQSAYRLFLSEEFRDFLKEKRPEFLALYDSLGIPSYSYESLEAFLADTGAKEPLTLSLSLTRMERTALTEPVQETVQIIKNTWGFQKITIESDAAFLRPQKKILTTDEFAGSTYDLSFVLDTDQMHAGKNYGRLSLTTPVQTLYIEVTAARKTAVHTEHSLHTCKRMQKELEQLYVNFRLGKIDHAFWVSSSIERIAEYKKAGGRDVFAELFLIQLYYADGQKEKAYQLLEQVEAQKSRLSTPERYGFCLYMGTFFYQEVSYVDRVEAEVSRLFYRDKTNWKLQWILLYLKEELLHDDGAKYEAAARQFQYGCRSRIMYLEAYQILKKNPFLMRSCGDYEMHLLRFAAKEGALTEEIVRQMAILAMHQDGFSPLLFENLKSGYEAFPSEDLIRAICMLLIKGGRKERDYFEWYEKGVNLGLRITGLYEYYMETMDCLELREMPQIIRMYFAYDTTLDYRKRAAIFRRIVENRENDPQTFRNYRTAIEKFTLDQLEAMRISEDLSVLYQEFIRRQALTHTGAEKLTRLLFTCEITCHKKKISRIIVHSARLKQEQVAVVTNDRAYIQIYDPQSVIFAEDEEGRRYLASYCCEQQRVFENEEMLEWCAKKTPGFPGLVLSICVGCLQEGIMNRNSLPYFQTACRMPSLTDEFRDDLRKEVLHYYMEHLREPSLADFLDQISCQEYIRIDKTALIVLLAEEGRCREAFALLDSYGSEGIPLLQLVRICSRMILDLEFEEDTMLVSLCHSCFAQGKYDDKLLRYLMLYYEGPAEEMKQVWQAARSFELDTLILEEKYMMMILFTRNRTQGSECVFEAYLAKMGRKKLCRAYVNLKAYEYFVKNLPVADSVFLCIEKEYNYLKARNRLGEQEEVCRLALLLYYARIVKLNPFRRAFVQELLEEFAARGMRFEFWKRFDRELLAPYQMEGRVFAEYVAPPESTVHIFYRRKEQEEYIKETVKNYFEGIFVKEFTLFYGEEVTCYFEEENGQNIKKSGIRVLRMNDGQETGALRYDMLNRIARAAEEGQEETARDEVESYLQLEYLTKEVFTLI